MIGFPPAASPPEVRQLLMEKLTTYAPASPPRSEAVIDGKIDDLRSGFAAPK